MGGGKGGSDFDPKAVQRRIRCASANLLSCFRHRPDTDVPAGDIGVGGRGSRLHRRYVQAVEQPASVFTGKGPGFGGSFYPSRSHWLKRNNMAQKCWPLAAKSLQARKSAFLCQATWLNARCGKSHFMLSAKVSVSDSSGTVYAAAGFTPRSSPSRWKSKNEQYGRVRVRPARGRRRISPSLLPWTLPCPATEQSWTKRFPDHHNAYAIAKASLIAQLSSDCRSRGRLACYRLNKDMLSSSVTTSNLK